MNDEHNLAFKSSDAATIKTYLDEANTVFLVIASVGGVADSQLQSHYETAEKVAKAKNSLVWRVLWIEHPENLDENEELDKQIKTLFWGPGFPAEPDQDTCIVVVSLGTGLDRVRKASYKSADLSGAADILGAFAKG